MSGSSEFRFENSLKGKTFMNKHNTFKGKTFQRKERVQLYFCGNKEFRKAFHFIYVGNTDAFVFNYI